MPRTPKLASPQTQYWVLTLNNYTPEDIPTALPVKMSYIVMGEEVSETGTPHLQGYLCFKNRQRRTAVSKMFPRASLRAKSKYSTHAEASDYCKKDGKFVEFGTLSRTPSQATSQRNKHNWEEAFKLAASGKIDEIPYELRVRYYHAFKRIAQDHPIKHKPLDKTCGIWFYGETGVGKSKKAREKYPDFYDKPLNKWWDGYTGQKNVILDDLDPSHGVWIGPFLKRWTDHYAFPAEQKGTTVQIRPQQIIVTSQHTIEEVFELQDQRLADALNRRFKVITMEPVHLPQLRDPTRIIYETPPPSPLHKPMDIESSEEEILTKTVELTLSESLGSPEMETIDREIDIRLKRIARLEKKLL